MEVLEKIAQKVFKNMPLIFGAGILFMDIVAISAPILAHFNFTTAAHWIYTIYSFLCHQRPWRSLHLFDYQVAWCSRDTFIYLSMALSAFFVVKFRIRGIKWYVPLICILPFAFDGTLQLIAEIKGVIQDNEVFFYASTNFIRMLTGTIFGAGAGLWIFGLLDKTIEEELNTNTKIPNPKSQIRTKFQILNSKRRNILYFFIIIAICFITYLGFVQLWRITSERYKPSGLLDNVRYFPGVNYEEVDRCGHCV